MNKYIYILLIISGLCFNKLIAQNFTENKIPQENVFLHFNTSFLVTGESIYYKLYCLNSKTQKLSTLSKIAYVELIDSDYKLVFKHKIKLEKGVGFGDFFIPSNVSSGNYKLIAYTQWMLNWSNSYFHNDISIINPFDENKPDILVKNDSSYNINTLLIDPLKTISQDKNTRIDLTLSVKKDNYDKREKVQVNITSNNPLKTLGEYSVSVNKIDSIVIPKMYSPLNYKELFKQSTLNERTILPELRGELISGKVLDANNQPIQNKNVGLSIPGKNFLFKIATTNSKGDFYTYLNNTYGNENAIFQIIDNQNENQFIHLNGAVDSDVKNLKFSEFKITKAMQGIILKRSVQTQIENSYSRVKLNIEDSILPITPFYESKITNTYALDDYTRFPTVKETVVEIMPEVFIRTRKKQSTLHLIIYEDRLNLELLPMIIIDGVLVQNHEELLAYNSNSIDKIHVVGSQYIYGAKAYGGIIAIETKSGNYSTSARGDFIKDVNLFRPLIKKTYYKHTYEIDSKFDRIPDYRNLLLWQPSLTLPKEDNEISFYTSDVPGYYQIRLEGFNEAGAPVSLQKIIKVN